MRTRNNNNGYKIIDNIYESKPNGIGFRQLMRKTGLYQKVLSLWLKYLIIDLNFIKKDPKGRYHLTENTIKKYTTNTLIIPLDPNSKKFKKMQKKQFVKREFGKNYSEIIILTLSLATFGSVKLGEYKKPKLGLVVIHDPINTEQTYMYGIDTTLSSSFSIGIGLNDLMDKLPDKTDYSPNEKAVLPNYYTNYGNNELFGYLRLSKDNAQKSLKVLSKEYNVLSPIIKDKTNGNEIRYQIYDELLKEFVEQCILAFNSDVDQRLEYAYISEYLNDKQLNEYSEFLKKWYGLGRKYSNIDKYLKALKERGMDNNSKEHYKKYIDDCDKDIFNYGLFELPKFDYVYDRHKQIIGKKYELIVGTKYKSLERKYPLIVNIFFDMLFPQFLRKIWSEQNKNQNK
jgi:hypothetical protein